jgi:ABC-type sulfate transport system permease component
MLLVVAIILARVLLELSPARWQTFGKMVSTFLVVEIILLLLGYYRASLIVSVLVADFFGWIHVRKLNPRLR